MIVMKFGGTSVGSSEAIKRVGRIVQSRLPQQPIVVVSAVGHITDVLVEIGQSASRHDRIKSFELILSVMKTHQNIMRDLQLTDGGLKAIMQETEEQLKKITEVVQQAGHVSRHISDELLSIGEFLSANILSRHLEHCGIPSIMVDSRNVLVTDSQFGKAQPQLTEAAPLAKKEILPHVQRGRVPVMQGFVGRDSMGRTTTLGRGGSDYSATLFGAMLDVQAVEIWTDVDGVLTADPTLVPSARRIRVMTFQEAAELAYFGARVLHPATLLPAVEKSIPVFVLNSHRPDESGTRIVKANTETAVAECVVKSIAYKENITVITVTSTRMLMAHGFLASIFDVFNRYQTAVDLVTTSEVSVSMTIDHGDHLTEIRRDLSHFAQVETQSGKAIVSLVGERMRKTPGMPGQIFCELGAVPIHLISQGASEINISFVIDEPDLPVVIQTLHDRFFSGELNPDIFVVD
jgi:aspartate kinase